MDVKKIIAKVCEGQYDSVEKSLNKEIAKIQEMRLFAKIIGFVKDFSHEMYEHQGKKLYFEIGYESDCFPQATTLFYSLDSKPSFGRNERFQIETGSELISLLEFAKGSGTGSLVIDYALEERMISLILGKDLLEKYMEIDFERRFKS